MKTCLSYIYINTIREDNMEQIKPKSVEEYIAASPMKARPIMNELRKIIKSSVPQVEEGISYGVPFYKYHGQFVGFAVYQNHVSFGVASHGLQNQLRGQLEKKGYRTGKKTIQIGFDQDIPIREIKQVLQITAQANEHKKQPLTL